MRALADEFEAICSAFFRENDEVVVRARAASMSQLGWSIPQGTRLPLRPPVGIVYHAWSPATEVAAWLDRQSPEPTPAQRENMLKGVAFAREQGFVFGVRNPGVPIQKDAPEQIFRGDATEFPITIESAIDPHQEYRLAYVIAPVFDAKQQVAFMLGLMGLTRPSSGAAVQRMGQHLRQACDRITNFAGRRLELPM
jgi:DNA-binding IclR family transcriptional regulator